VFVGGGLFILFPIKYSFFVPTALLNFQEECYKFLLNLFVTVNTSYGLNFFPLVTVIFVLVLSFNLLGLLPYGFTVTSQIFATFALSISTFIGITILGCIVNKFNFIKFFIPNNISFAPLRIFLIFIEVLSYIIRPFSLGIRLFANMLAGHTLIYILASFSYSIAIKFIFFSLIIPFAIIFLIFMLEFSIAVIQTYVFTILTIIYIKDVLNAVH